MCSGIGVEGNSLPVCVQSWRWPPTLHAVPGLSHVVPIQEPVVRHLWGVRPWQPVSCLCCSMLWTCSAFRGHSLLSTENNLLQGGMNKKRLHYIEGGHHGNREQYINNLVRIMN